MGKLTLQLESLAVESFDTSPPASSRGTVRAADESETFSYETCAPDATCGGTCPPACDSDGWGGCGGTAGTCPGTRQPTCYGTACDTWCCTPGTACGVYDTCGHNTCAFECTVTCAIGCVE